uniref:Uncharacterized protein n=1 Tax=Vespula pensylvanica TaxID=30213 RepID=A0A834U4N9_VESPE|nr:hypothetical protein H0235_011295 [Vespula pensylvanica]
MSEPDAFQRKRSWPERGEEKHGTPGIRRRCPLQAPPKPAVFVFSPVPLAPAVPVPAPPAPLAVVAAAAVAAAAVAAAVAAMADGIRCLPQLASSASFLPTNVVELCLTKASKK